jgi:Fe-S oxidoreductase
MGIKYEFEVLHVAELLEELIDSGNLSLQSTEDTIYAWHDPCHLGRHMGVYDAPRNVMDKTAIDYIEMEPNRENAWCCGAGGGARAAYSEWSLDTAKKRISQVSGTKNIVTACPFCVRNLRDASSDDYDVVDIIEIIDRLL